MAKDKGWVLDDSSLEPYKVESKKKETPTPKTKEEESKNVQKPKKL